VAGADTPTVTMGRLTTDCAAVDQRNSSTTLSKIMSASCAYYPGTNNQDMRFGLFH